MLSMNDQTSSGRLISFDESGFTGPELLNEEQPYFVLCFSRSEHRRSGWIDQQLTINI